MEQDAWQTVERLLAWLDGASSVAPETGRLLRMMKLSEEVGEVTEAVIGALGHNPRKGRTHTWEDVQAELCDVIITAMVALRTLTPDAPAVFDAQLRRVARRSGAADPLPLDAEGSRTAGNADGAAPGGAPPGDDRQL
ncbi:MazG-like family protein [Streptacidiphilus griseoplanus]|uniref:MazG-like family protein n=1 Tax=Peterkaempfera griseoplana TaxID=66896 RepID=UPI0007C6EC2F|nr:MazG-like family protein [Peterkaempfera griseoplana]